MVQRERDCHDVYSSLLRLLRPGEFFMCFRNHSFQATCFGLHLLSFINHKHSYSTSCFMCNVLKTLEPASLLFMTLLLKFANQSSYPYGLRCFFFSLSVCFEELYAFSYNPKQNDQEREEGWQLIDLGAEFERMGVPCDQWQLTDVNRDYKVCYPHSHISLTSRVHDCFICFDVLPYFHIYC